MFSIIAGKGGISTQKRGMTFMAPVPVVAPKEDGRRIFGGIGACLCAGYLGLALKVSLASLTTGIVTANPR